MAGFIPGVGVDTITITLDANGGFFNNTDDSLYSFTASETSGVTIGDMASEPIRIGYVFLGWSDSADGSVVYSMQYETANFTSAKVIYAVWEPDVTKTIFEKGAIDIIVDKIKNSGGVKTSTFTLDNDSSSYTFEVGMTWYEFVNSPYNTNSKFECTSDSNTVTYYDDSRLKFLYIRGNHIEVSGNHYVSNIYYVGLSGGMGN